MKIIKNESFKSCLKEKNLLCKAKTPPQYFYNSFNIHYWHSFLKKVFSKTIA